MKKKKLNTKKFFGVIAKIILLILFVIALGYAGRQDLESEQREAEQKEITKQLLIERIED